MLTVVGRSEGKPRGVCPSPLPALLLPLLDLQYYIDTRNRNHAFTLYSEVQKTNGQLEDNSYKCYKLYAVKKVRQSLNICAKIEDSNNVVTTQILPNLNLGGLIFKIYSN